MVLTASVQSQESSTIKWRPWQDSSFELSLKQEKPILLDITATWCHWCKVMDETTYSDPRVSELINKYFIAVQVDADRRPDIVNRYSAGGFPTTAFLMPNGDVITSATYIPPPEMLKTLQKLRNFVKENAEQPMKEYKAPEIPPAADLRESIVDFLENDLKQQFDQGNGGYGTVPKFPTPDVYEYLLHRYQQTAKREYLDSALKTLDKMYEGGLFDSGEGGFFRYSTRADWSVPHYEKMLDGNARLLTNYLQAFMVTDNDKYRQIVQGIISYLLNNLHDSETGLFYGSQTADEDYYKLSAEERKGKSAPAVDKTIFTNHNARAVRSFLLAYMVFDEERFLEIAEKNLAFFEAKMLDPVSGFAHYYENKPRHYGLLDDNLSMVEAYLDAYEYTGDSRYLPKAAKIMGIIDRRFFDPRRGRYFDIVENEDKGYLPVRFALLQDNARIAKALIRFAYYQLEADSPYYKRAVKVLKSFGNDYQKYGMYAASYGDALYWYWRYPLKAVVVGSRENKQTRALAREFQRSRLNDRITLVIDPRVDPERLKLAGYPVLSKPAIYLCFKNGCLPPITDPSGIKPALRKIPKP